MSEPSKVKRENVKGFNRAPRKTELRVLTTLRWKQSEPISIYKIAKESGVSRATAKNYVDLLNRLGFLEAKIGHKRNVVLYTLTDRGSDFVFARMEQYKEDKPKPKKGVNRLVEKAVDVLSELDTEQQVEAFRRSSGDDYIEMLKFSNELQAFLHTKKRTLTKDELFYTMSANTPLSAIQMKFEQPRVYAPNDHLRNATRNLEKILDRQFNINR